MRRRALAVLLCGGATLLPAPAPAEEPRLLAIGDIHGSLDGFTTILRETGLVDATDRWSGGRARLVQTGDFTDRGDDVRAVMDLLMQLVTDASTAGGEVMVLLGNHELLNLMRHDADVVINPRIYASFVDEGSEKRRRQALEKWKTWRRDRAQLEGLAPPSPSTEEQWLERRPLGFVEYHDAMSTDGRYGRWLRALPVIHRVGDTVFLHGGLSETFTRLSLERINELHREQIRTLDETVARLERKGVIPPYSTWTETIEELQARMTQGAKRQRGLIDDAFDRLDRFLGITGSADSPLWYRGFALPPLGLDDVELEALRQLLVEEYGAQRFVVAHSPFNGKDIAVRLDSFFLIDTGMLASVYAGRPSALEITSERLTAIYPGQRQQLLPAATSADGGAQPTAAGLGRATPRFVLAAARPPEPFAARSSVAPGPVPGDLRMKRAGGADGGARPFERPRRRWLDPDGEPLPFESPDDVERFLERATVLSSEPVGEGKTGALRLQLEHQGVLAHGIFHDIDDRRDPSSSGGPVRLSRGSTMLRFRDSYTGQVAAYRLARLMGLDLVPPAVVREVDGVEGSLALWIEGGTTLTAWRQDHPRQPQNAYYQQQLWDMRVFDALANNKDRNTGNIFWTSDWSVWLIDHTRTFAQDPVLFRPDLVQRCSRELLGRIQGLEERAALPALKPYLSVFEIKAIFKRRKKLLRYLEDRIAKLGKERVLFDYGDPLGQVVVRQTGAGAA